MYISDFYQAINGFPPYNYQKEVADVLLSGKNVILSVPTGAGKTWASIMPFLFAKNRSGYNFPKKMIYSLPLRALCNSISEDVKEVIKSTSYHGLASIQTGEYSEDKYFENDIIFSTIDQTLSNFLCFPLALSQRQANINAGALIGSYMVFDEFHLLDCKRSMATTLGMLRMLGNLSRFCIMTATLSSEFMEKLKGSMDNIEVVTLRGCEEDRSKIGSLKPQAGKAFKKEIQVLEGVIKAYKIKNYHKDKTIVICNRVETAQRLYVELEDWAKRNNIKLICLHSRFFDRHRRTIEKQLKLLFGKAVRGKRTNAILIATQVIEAGMDISCDIMHTEIAPINTILQRIGRCARYTSEFGQVFVYDVLEIEEKTKIKSDYIQKLSKEQKIEIRRLKNRYLPYSEELSIATYEKLKLAKNQKINESVAVRLVNEILHKEEMETWNEIVSENYKYNDIRSSWRTSVVNKFGARNFYRELIRDIQSTEIVIIKNRDAAIRSPFTLERIGIYKWSIVTWIKEIFERHQHKFDDESDFWVVGIIRYQEDLFLDLDENELRIEFHPLTDIESVIGTHETLFLNKDLFHYHHTIGLSKLKHDNELSSDNDLGSKDKIVFAYQKDTFIQHTEGLVKVYQQEFSKNNKQDFLFNALNERLQSAIDFNKVIQLILILHDYGKLNNGWQESTQLYQKTLSKELGVDIFPFIENETLGHSGFGKRKQKEEFGEKLQDKIRTIEEKVKKVKKRSPHSGIGAWVIIDVLVDWLGEGDKLWENLFIPASYAIARHHGVSNDSSSSYSISDHSYQSIRYLLGKYGFGNYKLSQKEAAKRLESFVEYKKTSFLIYLFFVRIVRLCDQKATDNYEKYID